MLVVINNMMSFHYHYGDPIKPLACAGDVIICIDPSKTNMAVLIGSPFGEIYSILEFSGNNRRSGPTMDTTEYCSEFSEFLRRYLANVRVLDCAVEKAITKKGMEHHLSNMVLTEIRGKILGLFSEEYGIAAKQAEINNYSWKHDILPDGYRGHGEKGSKRWMQDFHPESPLCNYFEADATDVFCIYLYKIRRIKDRYVITCNKHEGALGKYSYGLYPNYMDQTPNTLKFDYNKHFTLEDNAVFYGNRSTKVGIAKVGIDSLTLDDIYGFTYGFTEPTDDNTEVRVVVSRSSG